VADRIDVNMLVKAIAEGFDKVSADVRGLGTAAEKTEGPLAKTGKATDMLGSVVGKLVGAGVVYKAGQMMLDFGKQSLQASMNLEQAMANVSAVSGATGKDLNKLTDVAKELGATTKFTSQQAAEGMQFLAMAGFKVNEIAGAMPGVLQLAAAANLDLGRSADITSNILTGYGKKVEELGQVNDVLVKAFTSANVNLEQLGNAMKYVGPVASGMKYEFEEVAAAIALMGNAGIQGTMAGTALRGALSRLANPTGAVAATLARLAINVKDSAGNMRPLVEIVEQLEKSGATTSDMLTLFGDRAGPALAALVEQGSDALRTFTQTLKDSGGTADNVAETQMNTLQGRVLTLQSAYEGLKIAVGDAFGPTSTAAVEWATERVRELTIAVKGLGGTYADMVRQMTTSNIELAVTQEEATAQAQRLLKTYQDVDGPLAIATGGSAALAEAMRELAARHVELGSTNQETAAALTEFFGATVTITNGVIKVDGAVIGLTKDLHEQQRAFRELAAVQDAASFDRNFRPSTQAATEDVNQLTAAANSLTPAMTGAAVNMDNYAERMRYLAKASQDAGQASDDYEVTSGFVAKMEKLKAERIKESERALKEQEAALKAAEEAQRRLNAQSGRYFNDAMNAKAGAGLFNEELGKLGTQYAAVGGRSREQTAELQRLQTAYDKAAQAIRDYELGIKGAGLSEEQRAKKIAEQRHIMTTLEQSMAPLLAITGSYAEKTVEATINQDAVNRALYDSAAAAGASAEQLAILGGALGLYSKDAVEAALKSAAIQMKIDQLAQAYVAGEIGVEGMRKALAEFIAELNRVPDEKTVNIRTNYSSTGAPPSYGGGSGGEQRPEHRAGGGPVNAGRTYRVGEGNAPELYRGDNGSLYMIPGDSGQVFSNASSQGMMGGSTTSTWTGDIHVNGVSDPEAAAAMVVTKLQDRGLLPRALMR
jgi:TP901 family phage tail tape measure protein